MHAGRISRRGVEMIAQHEGLRLSSYKDTAGVWTIGFGHTGYLLDGRPVGPGQRITREEALRLFARDLEWVEDALAPFIPILHPTPNEFDALASLVFNTGAGILQRNKSMGAALLLGDRDQIAKAFLRYRFARDAATGEKVPILYERRLREVKQFYEPIGATEAWELQYRDDTLECVRECTTNIAEN